MRRFTTQRAEALVPAFAVAAAVAAAFSGAEATGTIVWDQLLLAATAAMFVLAAGVTPLWALIIVSTVAVVFVRSSIWVFPVGLGLLLVIVAVAAPRVRWLAPLAAALSIQGLFRLSDIGFFGLPSLLAGASILIVLAAGFRTLETTRKRSLVRVGVAATVLAIVFSVVGGLVLLSARPDVEAGIEAARAGVAAARDGEPAEVVDELEVASGFLTAAEGRVNSLLATPLRLLPVASQHVDVIRTAVRHGSDIAELTSRSVSEADIGSITMQAGSVDLSALTAMQPDLVATAELLERAADDLTARRSGWLLAPIGTRVDDLTDELVELVPEARLAADAASVVPGLLSNDGPRRYFVAFGSPAESRELGGFVGSWALLELDRGSVRLIDSSRIQDLYDLTRQHGNLSLDRYPFTYSFDSQPHAWPQNITGTPDLTTVAAASRELFDGLGDGPIDGFVYVDSVALGAFIELTGPIRIDSLDEAITPGNAREFFLDGQYRLADRDELKADLGEIFRGVFEGLLDTTLPGPERLGRILGPSARQGHLQVATFDEAENAFFRSIKVQRPFGWPVDDAIDAFAIVGQNNSISKLDLYLHREVTYDIEIDDDGLLDGRVTVVLESDVPDDAPPLTLGKTDPDEIGNIAGRNVVQLSLFTPHIVDRAVLDGSEVVPLLSSEFGYSRAQVEVTLEPGEVRTVVYDIRGVVPTRAPYSVQVWHQPLVNDDLVEISVAEGGELPQTKTMELTETTLIDFGP